MGTMALSGCCLSTGMLTTKEKKDDAEAGKNTDYTGASLAALGPSEDNIWMTTTWDTQHTHSACGPADWHSLKNVLTPLS